MSTTHPTSFFSPLTQTMKSFSKSSTYILLLLFFLSTNKNVAREIKITKNNKETTHATSMTHMNHIDITSNLFFHIQDLKLGHKLPLYFPIKDPSKVPNMISKQEADTIPFSTTKLPEILEFFEFDPTSKQAQAIQETLHHCQAPAIEGETKFCATSLESMLENLTHIFGDGNSFKVLTTTQMKNWAPKLQNYTLLDHPREVLAPKMVGCHPVPYPYAVFYCHGQKRDTKLFVIPLQGEDDGVKLDAVGVCHMDTSLWDPSHVSFRVMGIEPGTEPVCHIFPQDNLVWVSSMSSDG